MAYPNSADPDQMPPAAASDLGLHCLPTVKTLNIGTPRPATIVVLIIKQFNFTMK